MCERAINEAERIGEGDTALGAKIMAGAGLVAGTTVGVFAGSATLGLAAAAGATYATTRMDGIGGAAKATGTAAVAAGEIVERELITEPTRDVTEAARDFDQRLGVAIRKALAAAREVDEKYDVTGKITGSVSSAMNDATKSLVSRTSWMRAHAIGERAVESWSHGAWSVAGFRVARARRELPGSAV